jgi:hypothetical protein
MANPASSILASVVTWNSLTWNADGGGPIGVEWSHEVQPVEDWTGADEYPRQVFTPRKRLEVRVILRDTPAMALAAFVGSIVVTYKTLSSTKSKTFANMKYVSVRSIQGWGDVGSEAIVFVHQSSDGTTNPVS